MAEEKMRSTAELEKENEALKAQLKKAGLKVPVTVAGTHKYSGKEAELKGEYGFKTGCTKLRISAAALNLSNADAAELYDSKGLLISAKAIENADVMNQLIERKVAVLYKIEKEAAKPAAKPATKK